MREEEPGDGSASEVKILDRFTRIFSTGVSELKRKSAVTRLHFEIKGLEKDKEKHFLVLGKRAWDAHVEHSDLAGILVHLKELQIEMNRLETQFGEHDTQIKDIELMKGELTDKFNANLDQLEERIVPHRQKIEIINAEKEDNKVQIEELRSQQDHFSQQVRNHQKSIQEFDLADDADKTAKIDAEKESIRQIFVNKCEIECKIPFLHANLEKLKLYLANEKVEIDKLDQEKDTAKREYEQRIRDYNQEIHQLEEKKRLALRSKDQRKRDMEPYQFELGKKMEQLRLQGNSFSDVYSDLDGLNTGIDSRRNQIAEAASLSRAMDRSAWMSFLVVSGTAVLLFIGLVVLIFHRVI